MNVGPRCRWLNVDVAKASIMALAATIVITSCGVIPTMNADTDSPAARCTATAAERHGWGDPIRQDEFADASSLANWHLYSGPGHAGNGRRTPTAITLEDDAVVIKGNAQGYSGGMGWDAGQLFGRWEACSKSPPSAPGYHSLLLLWPDAEDWPVGGEIDFMEAVDPTRQSVEGWLHYGPDDRRTGGTVAVDETQWHAWAVEWTAERITMYLDGEARWTTTDKATFPPRPLHLCLQVDNFGGDIAAGGQQMIDWTRQYRLN
jgi:hypothetical protein